MIASQCSPCEQYNQISRRPSTKSTSKHMCTLSHADYKEIGNNFYKEQDYKSALNNYALAIEAAKKDLIQADVYNRERLVKEIKSTIASYYGNRAAAHTMSNCYKKAIEDCNEALKMDPKFFKAYYRKGKILTMLGQLDRAVKVYSKGMKYVDDNQTYYDNLLKERDECFAIKGRFYSARDMLAMNEKNLTTNARRRDSLLPSSTYVQDTNSALKIIEEVITTCPNWKEILILKIKALSLLNRNEEALNLAASTMKTTGSDNELSFIRAKCIFNTGNLEGALGPLREILTKDAKHEKASELLMLLMALKIKKEDADTAYKKGNFKSAIALYAEAIDMCPNDNRTYVAKLFFNRAVADANLLMHREAVEDCTDAILLDNDYVKALLRRAASSLEIGGTDAVIQAIADYDKAEELEKAKSNATDIDLSRPGWKEAMILKARAYGYLNQSEEAYNLTTKLIQAGVEHDSRLLLLRAKCLFYMGTLDSAVETLRFIISSDPDNKKAASLLKALKALKKAKDDADAAFKAGDYEIAASQYGTTLDICPTDNSAFRAKLYFNRAAAHVNLRKHEEVIIDCTEAISLNHEYFKAYMRRAESYLVLGGKENADKAKGDFEKAMAFCDSIEEREEIRTKIHGACAMHTRENDFYQVLGVARDASDSEIKKKYRLLALKLHPDRHTNSSEEEKQNANDEFKKVNHAYEVLSDPSRRESYDKGNDNA